MTATATKQEKAAATESPWEGFKGALWQREINVRAFIQLNYTPYDGDESFLAPATARTKKIWEKLTQLFVEERKKGVLDISQIPSSITAHAPGYIDKNNEVIVGLQTEAPLKRAIMPNGGFRMVLSAFKAYGYTADPHSSRRSRNTGRPTTRECSTRTPPTSAGAAARTSSRGCPMRMAAAGSSVTTGASRSTVWTG